MAYEQSLPTGLDFDSSAASSVPAVLPLERVSTSDEAIAAGRPWVAPRLVRRLIGGLLATQALSSCLAVPTDKQIGASNRVEDHLPSPAATQTTVNPSSSADSSSPSSYIPEAPTATMPPTTAYPQPSKEPEPTTEPPTASSSSPLVTQAPAATSFTEGAAESPVIPDLSWIPDSRCAARFLNGKWYLEGLVAPNCAAAAPVLVVGEVTPICRILGQAVLRDDGENANLSIWVVFRNQNGHLYTSPNDYLSVPQIQPCPTGENLGAPLAD